MPGEKENNGDEAARLKQAADNELDRQLEDTFPASDPTNVTRSLYERPHNSSISKLRRPAAKSS